MRTCPNCGHMLSDKDTICFKCGIQLPSGNDLNYNNQPPQPQQMTNFDFRGSGNKKTRTNSGPAGAGVLNLDGNKIYYVLGVIIVIVVIIGIAVIVTKSNSNNTTDPQGSITLKDNEVPEKPVEPKPVTPDKPTEPDEPDTPVEPDQPDEPEQPPEPELPPNGIRAGEGEHLVTNSNYTYRVPNEYIEKDYGKTGVDLINAKNTVEMMISINEVPFSDIRGSINSIKQSYMENGTTVYNVSTQIIEGSETIIIEAERDNQRVLIGILEASTNEIFVVSAFNKKSNEFDYDLFKEGVRIAKTGIKDAVIVNNTSNDLV